MEDYKVRIPGTAYAPFEYNCDFYLEDNKHIIKISKRHDQINNDSCLYFTKDDNTETIGSSYIQDDRDGSMQNPSSLLSPAGDYVNGKWYIYDLYYFKKAPEGDFKTWLENNCRRIL